MGLAFSEAKRSREVASRIKKPQAPPQKSLKGKTSSKEGTGGKDAEDTSGTKGRRRRRRRHRGSRRQADLSGDTALLSGVSNSSYASASSNCVSDAASVSSNGTTTYNNTITSVCPLSKGGSTSKKQHDAPMTKGDLYFCLRCGVVVTGKLAKGTAVGRVTLVNWDHQTVLDTFVRVPQTIADYRTATTGITPADLSGPNAVSFDQARTEISKLIKGKILVGHGLEIDLAALGLSHPWCDIRDTATYAPFMNEGKDQMLLPQELSVLSQTFLQYSLNGCPVTEAKACMELYKKNRNEWESALIKVVQLKEKQRQLVLNMRSAGSNNTAPPPSTAGVNNVTDPLSTLRESSNSISGSISLRPINYLTKTRCFLGRRGNDNLRSSLSSTQPSSCYTDDASFTSDVATGVAWDNQVRYSPRPACPPPGIVRPSEPQMMWSGVKLREALPVNSTHGSVGSDSRNMSPPPGILPISTTRDIWGASPPSPNDNGVSSLCVSQLMLARDGGSRHQESSTHVSEADLLQHLPSHLIEDLDVSDSYLSRSEARLNSYTRKESTSSSDAARQLLVE